MRVVLPLIDVLWDLKGYKDLNNRLCELLKNKELSKKLVEALREGKYRVIECQRYGK